MRFTLVVIWQLTSLAPELHWAAASQHCGLIEQNIRFLMEKICSLHHSLPFEMVPGIMVVCMVLHIIKFVNGFPRWGGVKHYSPGAIMTGCNLHGNNIILGFGVYCQIAKMLSPEIALLQEGGLQCHWTPQATWRAAYCSLLWTLAPL